MSRRTGSADLPLHNGRVPPWLGQRMTRLGRVLVQAIVAHYGRDELRRRLAHPFWFQSFGAVMGMDWHSSGITTSVMGALKRGLAPLERELGLFVCGGRGRHSRKTSQELVAVGAGILASASVEWPTRSDALTESSVWTEFSVKGAIPRRSTGAGNPPGIVPGSCSTLSGSESRGRRNPGWRAAR